MHLPDPRAGQPHDDGDRQRRVPAHLDQSRGAPPLHPVRRVRIGEQAVPPEHLQQRERGVPLRARCTREITGRTRRVGEPVQRGDRGRRQLREVPGAGPGADPPGPGPGDEQIVVRGEHQTVGQPGHADTVPRRASPGREPGPGRHR
ncbi:hypothetical protein [Pseudonocardia sp. HH130630-07]|uniref:hypothetical protein n=1 Tax=Pseudonocardia sp. HH130630-07 TaxID=1690815 RepID=UPI000814C6F5|nr:hypothetical protein [Pseudonocardia sp. HH130630-07]ANY05889.1 hypothetical protein AFB00_05760 [Pseudonocardia sp. HH130630-07]